jgi:putative heme-binding domain-containing protein
MPAYRDGHTESTAHAAKAWQVRLTGQMTIDQEDVKSLVGLAKETPSATVRRELASAALRMTAQHDTTALLTALAGHGDDADDPLIPHLVWLAWEKEFTKQRSNPQPQAMIDRMVADAPTNRLVRDHLLPKTLRRIATAGEADGLKLCIEIVAKLKDVDSREKALDGIALALQGRTVDMPVNWPAIVRELRLEPKLAKYAETLAVSFRDPEAVKRAFTVMRDSAQPDTARAEAIRQLTMLKPANVHKAFITIIKQDFPEAVKIEAARGLSTFDEASLPGQIIALWPAASAAVKSELVNTLASRKNGAKELLAAMKAGRIDRTLATDQVITRIQAFNDRELNALIESAWGRTRKTPVELQRLIDKTRDEIGMTPASFERGRVQFETQCAKCHQFEGKGQSVGPALDGAGRDIDYIVTNVIDPNRVIGAPYFLRTAQLADGKIEQGVLAEEDDKFITLKTENGVLKKIAKADLDGPVRVVEKSMMPEGLTAGMKPADFRDLVRYLMANPFVCDVTVNGEAMRVGANGKILLPAKAGEVTVRFSVTSPKAMTTSLLVGCTDDVTVSVGGNVVGSVRGSGRRPSPDQGQTPLTLAAGTTTVTVTVKHAAASDAIYLRLIDPDRLLRYPGE